MSSKYRQAKSRFIRKEMKKCQKFWEFSDDNASHSQNNCSATTSNSSLLTVMEYENFVKSENISSSFTKCENTSDSISQESERKSTSDALATFLKKFAHDTHATHYQLNYLLKGLPAIIPNLDLPLDSRTLLGTEIISDSDSTKILENTESSALSHPQSVQSNSKSTTDFDQLLKLTNVINVRLKELTEKITKLEAAVMQIVEYRNSSTSSSQIEKKLLNCLPLTDISSLNSLEDSLYSEEHLNTLVKILHLAGGETAHKSIYLQMGKLLTNELALQCSGIGRTGKLPFCQLKMFQVIMMATRKRFPEASELEIKKSTCLFLASAKSRLLKTNDGKISCATNANLTIPLND